MCTTTPSVTVPQWLESGGSARSSCQRLFKTLTSVDFQVHYMSGQVIDNFKWPHSQMQKIIDGCFEVTQRITQLEILVFHLDSLLEGVQEQLRWLPQKGVLPKSQPKSHARPRPSSVVQPKKATFKRKVQRSYLKKARSHESRLQAVESASNNLEAHSPSQATDKEDPRIGR